MSWDGVKREDRLGLPLHAGVALPLTLLDNTPMERTVNGRLSTRDEMGLLIKETEGDGSNNNPQTSPQPEPPNEELRQLLLAQLEYYFSPDNLSTDKFLVSQMDSDQYVYISTVANFNMIKKLTSDLDLITDVLRNSKQVQVHSDGKRVRPVSNRTQVILRGIAESTPIEEIKALFETENSPRCNQCEFAFNDSWYLSFDSDEDAVRAHRYLREEVREFKGQPIMARIKSRPTTLLSQGSLGVNPIKNGYHQPSSLPPYIPAAYVPVSQNGPASSVTSAPMYPTPQQTPAVFTMPQSPYLTFGGALPWTGFYEMNHPVLLNGFPTQSAQPSPKYANAPPMAPRHRPPKPDSDSFHGHPRGGGAPRRTHSTSESVNGSMNGPGHYGGPPSGIRKNGGNGAPAPLLGMAPAQPPLTSNNSSHPPHNSHNHQTQPTSSANSSSQQLSTGSSANNLSLNRNGHLHYSSLPIHPVPHHIHAEQAYHRNSYRGDSHSRPRSSLGTRRPMGRGGRDEEPYESPGPLVGPNRGIPSVRNPAHTTPLSPSLPPAPLSANAHPPAGGRTDFDLEVSAFPPLPGSLNPPTPTPKTEESPYEGRWWSLDMEMMAELKLEANEGILVSNSKSRAHARGMCAETVGKEYPLIGLFAILTPPSSLPNSTSLSDVVKGVKTLAVREKEERENEIVVSAEFGESSAYVVSVASPTREVEGRKSSQSHSPSPSAPSAHNKKYREVGVGSADDNHEIRASTSKECVVKGTKGKEMADKSTQVKQPLVKPQPNPTPQNALKKPNGTVSGREEKEAEPRKKEVGSGEGGKVEENCSKEESEGSSGPVRLSYAQVAQRSGSEKGGPPPATAPQQPPPPAASTSPANSGSSGGTSTTGGEERSKRASNYNNYNRDPPARGPNGPPPYNSRPSYKRPPYKPRDYRMSGGPGGMGPPGLRDRQ